MPSKTGILVEAHQKGARASHAGGTQSASELASDAQKPPDSASCAFHEDAAAMASVDSD